MHGDEDDGSSLLHALKDRPRTTHAHTLAHMEAGRITQNVEETGRLLTKSKEQILDERKKLMYTRRPVIETLALVSYELQMFQRQFAPRPEGIHKLRSKSKSANQVWGVDLHKLRDVRKPRQRILGLKISKDDIPSLKMADASDSDSDFSGEEGDMTQKAARLANHHGMSSGSRSGTTPHTAYSSMHASGAASHSTSRAASRPLSPVGETHHKALHKYRKAPKWQKAVQKKNASVAFEAQSSEVETKTQQEEAIAAIEEDPGQAVSNFFPAPWSTNWAPELEGSEPTPAPLGWEALPKRKPAAGPTAPTEAQQFSNRDFHHLFTRTKSRAVVPKAAHHAPEVGPSQEGVQIGSSFVLGAPADAEQQAAHLEKQGRQQQERLMQERFELDRLRMQQQEMLIQQQQEQERQAELEGERSLNISSSKPRLHRGPSAKGEGERSLEATPSRSGRDPRRSHFGEGAREQQLQQMSPGHGLVRRPNEGGQVGIQSTPSASVGAQEQNLVSRPQMPDDMSYEDIKLPKCLSGVSAISRTERSIKGSSRSMLHFKSSKGSRSAERGGSAEVDGRPKSTDSPKQQGKAMRECDDGEQSMEVPPQNSRPSGAYISMEDSGGKELFDKEDGAPPPNSMTWPAGQSPSPTVRDGLLTPAESELLSHSSTKDRGTPKGRRPASSPVQGRPDSPTALTAAADRDTLGPSPDASGHEGGIASSSSASRTSFGARDASSRSFSSAGAIASTGVGARKDLSKIGGAPQQALRGRQRRASAPYSPLKDLPDTASHVGQDGEQPLHQQEKEGSPLQQRGSAAPGFDTEVQRELLSSHLSVNSSSVSGAKGVEARHAENEDGGHDQIKQALKKSSEPSDGSAGDPTLAGTRTTQSESQTRRGVKESRGAALKPSSPASMAKSNAWINENVPGKKNGNASPVIPAPDLPDAAAVQADSSSDPQPSFSLPPRIVSSSVSSSPRGHVPIRQVQVSAATQQDLCAVVAKVNPVAESARVGGDSVVPAADAAAALTSSATELKPNSPAQAAAAAAAATAAAESRPHAEPQPGVSDEVGNRDLTGSASPPPASPPQSPRLGRALNRKASPPKTHSSASATLHGTTRRAATRLGRVGAKEEGPREHSNALTASCNGASMPLNSSAYPPGYKWTMAQVSAILQSRHAANVQSSRGNHLTQTALMRPKEGDSQIKGGLELVEQLASLHRQLANPKGTAAPAPTPTSLLSAPSSPNISPPRRATSASAPSAFFGSTRAPQSGPFMQHHLYHHASPQQQVHRDKQRSLHHNLSAPTPFSLSSTPLAPTPLNPAPPLTPCGTKAHSLSGNTQQTEGMDQPTSPKILMLPTAEEALHTTASDSPLKPQASVSWPATPPGTAKQGPLPADTLAPPPSSHMSLPASLPASPASSCTADRACSPSSGGRTRNLSLSPRGSHALSAAERGPTPHPWTPSLQAPRFLHPSPSLSSAGTHCSPVSSQISKSPLPGCDLEVPWGGMRSQSEATHTLKESSLILSLLRSVRGALPPNSIAHQHHPRPRTSERFSAPSSTIKSSPASLRKLASPSPIDASPAAPLIPALLLRSTPPSVPSSKSPQQHKGTFGTASDAPSLGHHHPHANQPSRHAPFPISVDPCPLLPAASPLQHHQPLPTPPLLWPASPLSHPTQPNSPPYSVSSLEKPARVGESIPVNRKPLLARCPSIMYQHPKSRVGLYDATHLRVPPLSNVDPLDLGEGCPPEVQELLLQKLGGWLPHEIGGAAAHSPVGTCCGKTSAGECQRDGDRQDVGGEEQQSMQCRGRQTTTAHGPWPADHSKCAGPMCRAAQVGKAQWWAPGDDDWPFAQGGPASGADRAGLRQQLMSSFAQFG